MEVGVRVEAENPRTGEVLHTNTAYLTMVAVDDDGRPDAGARRCGPRRPTSCAARPRRSCAAPTGWPSASRSSPSAAREA